MIPAFDPASGALPPGRYQTTVGEVAACLATNPHRQDLWLQWRAATELLSRHVPVLAAWISGGFVSDREDPDDVDCVYWVEDLEFGQAALRPDSHRIIEIFAQKGMLREHVGLQIDTFIAQWSCCSDLGNSSYLTKQYWASRGHWDDFWSRMRSSGKGAPAVRADALPRRGYLEVIIDGFT